MNPATLERTAFAGELRNNGEARPIVGALLGLLEDGEFAFGWCVSMLWSRRTIDIVSCFHYISNCA